MKKYVIISICFLWGAQVEGQCPGYVDGVSPREFAALSLSAYDTPEPLFQNNGYARAYFLGWNYIDHYESSCAGYFGVAFKKGNKIIVAHRGTVPSDINDLYDDLFNVLQEAVPAQFVCARGFIDNLKNDYPDSNYDYYYTGHSLGAILSEVSAAYDSTSRKSVSFESPGSPEIIIAGINTGEITIPFGYTQNGYLNSLNLTTYVTSPNQINSTNDHLGRVIRIYPTYNSPYIFSVLCPLEYSRFTLHQHGMKEIFGQFDINTNCPLIMSDQTECWPEFDIACFSEIPFTNYNKNPYYWYESFEKHNLALDKRVNFMNNELYKAYPVSCGISIIGNNENNFIFGSTNVGDDIKSFNGNDVILGFEGSNVLNAGQGIDSVSYDWIYSKWQNNIGVEVFLNNEFSHGKNFQDYLIDFENVLGSDFDDLIVGNASNNTLNGGKGDDVLEGFGGTDILKGGPGKDKFLFKVRNNQIGIVTILDDDGEIYIGNNKFEGTVAQNCFPYHLTVGGVEYTLLLLPDRLEIYENGSNEKIIIPNFAEGKFGIKFNVIDADIIGRRNRKICADLPIENTLEVVVQNCNDCTTSWPNNKYTITMPGIFPVSVIVTDANGCSTTASTTVTIETVCCHDCDTTQTNNPDSTIITGDPSTFPCVTSVTFICIPFIRASDPNEIIGPAGYGDERWVARSETLPYTVYFENDPDLATAPAQRVLVRVPIDPHLNPFSLRLGNFGFGPFHFTIPPNQATWTQRLDVRDSLGVFVDLTAGLDFQKNEAFWILQSIDPLTGLAATLPANTGFLPVNDSITHRGEGYVSFTLIPKITAMTEDTVSGQAFIYFDDNEAIATNIATNIIDAFPPVSAIDSLPPMVDTSCVTLQFSAQDDPGGVGVASFDLYVAQDNSTFVLYKEHIDTSVFLFCGEPGSTYRFYTRASDHVGNKELSKLEADETVTLRSNHLLVDAHAFLQGPCVPAAQLMHDSLRVQNRIPLTEPYTGLTNFTHVGGGGEQTTPAVLAVTGPDAIVDWVFLELRNADDPAQVMATRSALLQRDGDVVDVDGVSPVLFNPALAPDNYYLAVRHRNHLGVQLAAAKFYPRGIAVTTDFRTLPPEGFYAFNGLNPAQKLVGSNYALWAGNGRIDFQLKYNGSNNDRNAILSVVGLSTPNAIVPGYNLADFNLDGVVKYNGAANDRNVLLGNVGIATPSAVVHDQVAR